MNYSKIIALVLILSSLLFAQFSKDIEISSWYDDNLYHSPDPVIDLLTDVGLRLSYLPDNSNMNYYYNGSFFIYNEAALRNFSMHGIGFNYIKPFGEDEKHNFYLGAEWTLRLNGDEYNYYDYNQIYAYSNLNFDLDWFFVKSGYNFRYRSYSNLPDLTNYRHYLFLNANKSFPTKTTLIVEADIGYKSFAGQEIFTDTRGWGGKGQGEMSESTITNTTVSEIPSLSQSVLLARITQSLHDKVGLYVQYRRQLSLTAETNFVNADGYYQDEELFDDPFSYESKSYSSQLTWMLPWSMKLQVGGAFVSKNYISEQAFISAEDSVGLGGIRLDDRGSCFVNFTKNFYLNKNWLKSLHFNFNYGYIRNESNSYWYDYKNAVIGGGIQWKF
ncbi:MAG: hypothetical protein K8R79_11080 [Calditrichales bacterium]|nr:hypothetical protein [Calditrichales bacterium]